MKITIYYDETARLRNTVEFEFDGTKEEAEAYIAAWKVGEADIWDLEMIDNDTIDFYDTWDQSYDYDDVEITED